MNDTTDSPNTRSLMDRRRALGLLGLGSVALIAACADDGGASGTTASAAPDTTTGGTTAGTSADTTTSPATTPDTAAAVDADTTTPGETGGPFPSDGSNDTGNGETADVLHDSRAVRSDIRGDLDGSNVQDGTPLTLRVRTVQQGSGAALAGAAVYVWHCNRDGQYSGYDSAMLGGDFSDRSFLRGVQVADADGWTAFQTILPGRYQGRAFHIHFEVFDDAAYTTKLLTSQMAMDDALIDSLYADAGYDEALRADTDNAADGVFADGVDHQLLAVSGDVATGLVAEFTAVV